MKKYLQVIILQIILCCTINTSAQITGCTDPQSTNYNPAATINDGSCVYYSTSLPLTDKTPLSTPLLDETSGLEIIDGSIWTFGDSGNPNDIYKISPTTNSILQTVHITNATNVDWEDMTSNSTHLFVGDMGNNNGNRRDLKIYRINKNSLTPSATSAVAEIINFTFSDQTTFTSLPNNNNFDCESIIFFNDSIHLFSKDWVDKQTRHYVLPNIPGTQVARYRETLNAGFLVTSASIQSSGVITLIGYDPFFTRPVSMWMLNGYKNNLFFNGNKRKFDLSTELINGQVEGVSLLNDSIGYITNERFTTGATVAPKLRSFNLSPYLPGAAPAPKPVAGFTSNTTTVCSGSYITFTNQSTSLPTSYRWIFPGGTPSTSTSQNPQVQYQSGGIYSVTLIAGNSSGSDTIVKTNYLTINSSANSTITANGPTSFCSGSTVTLNVSTGVGFSYQWRKNTAAISGATTSTYVANTIGDYSCTITGNCGSSTSNVITVSTNSTLAAPAAPSGSATICRNTTGKIYTIPSVSGATNYTWSVPSGATIVSGQGTTSINVNFSSTAVAGNICVYASSTSCGNSASTCQSIILETSTPQSPLAIAGNSSPCASSTGVIYSCSAIANASSYTWTAPANSTITSGQGTNTITLNFTSSFSSGTIKVAAVNCVGISTTKNLSLQAKPSSPGTVTGLVAGVCAGSTNVSYSISPVSGASSYIWTAPSNSTIASGQGSTIATVNFNSSFSTGTISVKANNTCGTSSSSSALIKSIPSKPGTISGSSSVCANQSGVVYSVTAVVGTTNYDWLLPTGAIITSGQSTRTITVRFGSSSGSVKVRSGNGCGYSAYKTKSVSMGCREANTIVEPTEFNVSIFPNPSNTNYNLTFSSAENKIVVFILHDLAGREITRNILQSSEGTFQFGDDLSAGIYLAEIISGDERKILRVVKE